MRSALSSIKVAPHQEFRSHRLMGSYEGRVVLIADDLVAWLIELLADSGRKKLTEVVFGSEQERALRQVATAAINLTAEDFKPAGSQEAEHLAMVIGERFSVVPVVRRETLLEALQAGIAQQLAFLDDAALTEVGESSAGWFGLSGTAIAEKLAVCLVREITDRGARGGPLAPLANQLNHDASRLQGSRLEGALAELVRVVGDTLAVKESTLPAADQAIRLLERPAFLAGREELLADLDAWLTEAEPDSPRVVALCGLGGVGKSSLALEYAYRHLAGLGVAWMLEAEKPTLLAAAFQDLAAQLGVRGVRGVRGMQETGDPVAQVHGALAAGSGDWLLIFDNVPYPEALRGMLPPKGQGRVIITSQNPHWQPGQAVNVPVLGQDAAVAFIQSRIGSADPETAHELAAELDGLPLALEQACAFMLSTGRSVADYLALFRRRTTHLLSRGKPIGYGKQVATTWTLAFDQLQRDTPQAAALLRLLACYAPERIPFRLLFRLPPDPLPGAPGAELAEMLNDPLAADDAIAALREFSLISPPHHQMVSIHRLVQAVTIGQLSADQAEAWRHAARSLVGAVVPSDPEQPGTWPVFAAVLPHVQATHTADSEEMERVARYLGRSGNAAAARDLQQQIVDARERLLGPDDVRTLTARTALAWWTSEAGDTTAARDQQASAVEDLERVCGAEHPVTLTARAWLAQRTGKAGDAIAARHQYQSVLPILQRVCGADHIETLNARAWLAHWTGEAGDPAAARDEYQALLPDRERVCGAEHSRTLTDRANFAHWTGQAGDPAAARDQYQALIPVLARVCGADHPETLGACMNFVEWTGAAGDAVMARDELKALLPLLERAWGTESHGALTARVNLAHWTGVAGDAAAASDQYRALVTDLERLYGTGHPDTLWVSMKAADWTGAAGDAAAARDELKALLPDLERVMGAEHSETVYVRAMLDDWIR